MLLYRLPDGHFAVWADGHPNPRLLYSDPYDTAVSAYELGRSVEIKACLAPVSPGKIVGIGRVYRDHAAELGNPMPSEPVLFLKAPSSLIGPLAPIVLPPESQRVEYEGEVAVIIRHRLRRATPEQAVDAVLGVTAACDVTARDIQRRDPTFCRGKSFDTFCPLGPAVRLGADLTDLTVTTRLNGEVRQHAHVRDMAWPIAEVLAYVSRMMTLEAGDVVLTGTPAGVGPLSDHDRLEVEVSTVPVLANPVEAWRQG